MSGVQGVEVIAGQASRIIGLLQRFSLPTYKYHSVDPHEPPKGSSPPHFNDQPVFKLASPF